MEGGRSLYDKYSTVSDSGTHNFLRLRETVLLRKEARKMFVQANTKISGKYMLLSHNSPVILQAVFKTPPFHMSFPGDAVELVEYESSAAGLICSFVERFQDDVEKLESDLLEMSRNDAPCWCC